MDAKIVSKSEVVSMYTAMMTVPVRREHPQQHWFSINVILVQTILSPRYALNYQKFIRKIMHVQRNLHYGDLVPIPLFKLNTVLFNDYVSVIA